MSDYKDIFRTKESQNWCKLWTGVFITRLGLIDFVRDELDAFQQHLLTSLPPGTNCTSCTTPNVLLCPTPTICRLKHNKCNYHNNTTRKYASCPTHDKIRDALSNEHRFHSPSWNNTYAEKWTTSSWEIAKCFMPKEGYLDQKTIEETDLNGILSVIINCKRFQNVFAASLMPKTNICTQVRDIVNKVRHFESMDVNISDADLLAHLDEFINLLGDNQCLQGHPQSTDARNKLCQLKADTLSLTAIDAQEILDDALKQLHERKQAVESSNIQALHEIETLLNTQRQATMVHHRAIQKSLRKTISQAQRNIKTTATYEQRKIKNKDFSAFQLEVYQTKTKELKEDLLEFYVERRSSLSLSPLLQDRDADLSELYVPPSLEKIDLKYTNSGASFKESKRKHMPDTRTPLESYKDIFIAENQKVRNVYIQGEPGAGKTSFCNKLIMDWCDIIKDKERVDEKEITHLNAMSLTDGAEASTSTVDNISSKNEASTSTVDNVTSKNDERDEFDKRVLAKFDFVFIVTLRDARGIDCDIDEMIDHQIIAELSRGFNYDTHFIASLLSKEKSLILLDGLDEWIHSDNNDACKRPVFSRSVPHRRVRKMCTIITTTRPWKMTEVRVKDSEIDLLVEITGIKDESALINNVLGCLNNRFSKTKQPDEFLKDVKDEKLQHFLSIPVIAMQLMCLWFQDKPFGHSRCEIYVDMMDLLLQMMLEKQCDDELSKAMPKPVQVKAISCLHEKQSCLQFISFLESISKLAYNALVSPDREMSIVFNESLVRQYLSDIERKIALESGILSQHKSRKHLTPEQSKYSFLHKTFQEFLAAFHFSQEGNTEDTIRSVVEVYEDDDILHIADIFVFVCGLNANLAKTLSESVMTILSVQSHEGDWESESRIERAQEMIVNGYNECLDNKLDDVDLALHCAIFSEDNAYIHEQLNTLLKMERNRNKLHTLIINSNEDLALDLLNMKHTNLKVFQLGENCLDFEGCIDLSCSHDITYLALGGFRNESGMEDAMLECNVRLNSTCIENCRMNALSSTTVDDIMSALEDSAPNLRILTISNCELPERFLRTVLPKCSSLTELQLYDMEELSDINVSGCGNLNLLEIYSTGVPNIKLNTQSLEYCEIKNVGLSGEEAVMKTLSEGAPKLQILNIGPFEQTDLLCEMLPKVCHVQTLYIEESWFHECSLNLKPMSNLREIFIGTTSLSETELLLPDSIQKMELSYVDLAEIFETIIQRIIQIDHLVEVVINSYADKCMPLISSLKEKDLFVEDQTVNTEETPFVHQRVFKAVNTDKDKEKVIKFKYYN